MTDTTKKPVIFLAFANDRDDTIGYLRNLPDEARRLRGVLEAAERAGLCEVIVRTNSTAGDIFKVFQDPKYRNRIAILHYGGHANGYQLLLESAAGQSAAADAGGLAKFLGQQQGLQLVFLNGCSTQQQTDGLLEANIPVVISTSRAIDDRVATDFSFQFYQGLAGGATIRTAYREAEAAIQTSHGSTTRGLYIGVKDDASGRPHMDRWPWNLYLREGSDTADQWNLPEAVNSPLFGLPPLPERDLPESPYRHLNWFQREHAEIFFGRGHQIRELYDRLVSHRSAPIVLFYGQSGVGKSSVLDAGLIPRLERDYEVRYRRRAAGGLLAMLRSALSPELSEEPIETSWRANEEKLNRPLILFLDQVEELYTRPLAEVADELSQLLKAVKATFSDPQHRPKGKLVLSFRKEWLAELETQLAAYEIPRSKIFLEALDRRGIIEVVQGPACSPRLKERYGLTVEDGLAEIIADDLLEDHNSAIAPTLQILLTKMWAKATEANYERPHFTQELYQQLKRDGILLQDFLDQQIAAFGQRYAKAHESGLLLDLLAQHTTSLGTADQRPVEQLQKQYSHLGTSLGDILQQCQDLYLLTMATSAHKEIAKTTRLAHDTLAPLVRDKFDKSDKPGQRARRILDNRTDSWKGENVGDPLQGPDLKVVESGVPGMRDLNAAEQRLLIASRSLRDRVERNRRWGLRISAAIVIVIFFLVSFAVWKGIEAQQNLVTAKESVEALLNLYLQIPKKAGEIAAAESPVKAHEAFEKLEKDGLPTSLRITSPEIAKAINKIEEYLPSRGDENGDAYVSEDCRLAILKLVEVTRRAWESRLIEGSGGKLDNRLTQQKRLERDIISLELCGRAMAVTKGIANAKTPEQMMLYRQEFERLYWGELYWLELEDKGPRLDKVGPLEEAMVNFREEGLNGWELENVSVDDLKEYADEVTRCCIALMNRPL